MNSIRKLGIFAAVFFLCAATNGRAEDFVFDGTTTGGWSLLNEINGFMPHANLVPLANFGSSGFNGIAMNDGDTGVAFYAVPNTLLSADLSDKTWNLNYEIIGSGNAGTYTSPITGFEDLYVNGTALSGYDIIDESIVDSMQVVTIDFADQAFSGIDLTNVASLCIRAEWWSDGGGGLESAIVSLPEPSTMTLLLASLLGMFCCLRSIAT